MKALLLPIPAHLQTWLATCRPKDAHSLMILMLAMTTDGRTPSPTIARSAIPPTVDLSGLVSAGIVVVDDQTATMPHLRKLAEGREKTRDRVAKFRERKRATPALQERDTSVTTPSPLSPPLTPPLTPQPQMPEDGGSRAGARGVPASIRAAEPLEPMAENVIAACERVTGRTPLKGHEIGACANWAAGMRFAYPDTKPITIHGKPSTLEAVIRAVCEHATPQTVSGRATTSILRWLETTVQGCIDGGILPGERLATRAQTAKLVDASGNEVTQAARKREREQPKYATSPSSSSVPLGIRGSRPPDGA